MSGAGEPTKPGNEDAPVDDQDSEIRNLETPPTPEIDATGLDSDPETDDLLVPAEASKLPTNGNRSPSKPTSAATRNPNSPNPNRGSGRSTPPRCDAPRLREILSSPSIARVPSSLVASQLLGVGNPRREIAGQEGVVPAALQGAEAVPEAVQQGSEVEVGNDPEGKQDTAAKEVGVPKAKTGTVRDSVLKALLSAKVSKEEVPEVKKRTVENSVLKAQLSAKVIEVEVPQVPDLNVAEEEMPEVPDLNVAEEEMPEVSDRNVAEVAADASNVIVPANSEVVDRPSSEGTEDMRTSEKVDNPSFKKPSVSTRIQKMKGKLDEIKLGGPNLPESPRRSARIEDIKRTKSESPSRKKDCKSPRSSTLGRTPSEEKRLRTRAQARQGSTSSNSEVEGSGDDSKKHVSRKDSKK